MVEGDDRTDRSPACGSPSDYGCQPDGPEEFDGNQGPKRPSKSAWDRNPLPTPRPRSFDEFQQSQGICTRWGQPEGLLFCKSKLAVPTYREEVGVHLEAQVLGQTQMVAHGGFQDSEHCAYLAFPN